MLRHQPRLHPCIKGRACLAERHFDWPADQSRLYLQRSLQQKDRPPSPIAFPSISEVTNGRVSPPRPFHLSTENRNPTLDAQSLSPHPLLSFRSRGIDSFKISPSVIGLCVPMPEKITFWFSNTWTFFFQGLETQIAQFVLPHQTRLNTPV